MTPRKMIAADLDRRADALFAAIDKMTTTTERSACYVAGTALRTAAEHTRRGIEFYPDAPTAIVTDLQTPVEAAATRTLAYEGRKPIRMPLCTFTIVK